MVHLHAHNLHLVLCHLYSLRLTPIVPCMSLVVMLFVGWQVLVVELEELSVTPHSDHLSYEAWICDARYQAESLWSVMFVWTVEDTESVLIILFLFVYACGSWQRSCEK